MIPYLATSSNSTFAMCTTLLYTTMCYNRGQTRNSLQGNVFFSVERDEEQHVLYERSKPVKMSESDFSVFRPDRPGIRKVLGDLEAEIMELVWSRPPGQGTMVRDVFEILYERREKRIAYTTVMNTMSRLAKKHLLRVEKKDQAYVYSPNLTQDEFVSRFVGRILEDLLVNFSGASLERLHTLPNSPAAAQARHYLEEITRRRQEEEEA